MISDSSIFAMMTDKTGRMTNSAPGTGGKVYPQVRASQQDFKALTEKLSKDWLMCLLEDTVDHLKSSS